MRDINENSDILKLISISDLERYLINHGWKRKKELYGRDASVWIIEYTDDNGNKAYDEVLVPLSTDYGDCNTRIHEVLEIIAKRENKNWLDVAEDLSTYYDTDKKERWKNALRAYLQRGEVRLSTMHRVGGVFLNGAGLIIIFSAFLKDQLGYIISTIVQLDILVKFIAKNSPCCTLLKYIVNYSIYALLTISPLAIIIFVFIYAIYHLLRDITLFYFIPFAPGFKENFFNPRFSLSGIAFSPDESRRVKNEIFKIQYSDKSHLFRFVIPFATRYSGYYEEVRKQTNNNIIPPTRENVKEYLASNNIATTDDKNIDDLNTAFGLTGVVDRTLVEEAAKMEVSLVRHAIRLRRLVLRYVKALIIFIITLLFFSLFYGIDLIKIYNESFTKIDTIVSIKDINKDKILYAYNAMALYLTFSIWALVTFFMVKLPVKWVYTYSNRNTDMDAVNNDRHLIQFEKNVKIACISCLSISLIVMGVIITYFF